jgi:hypothetical protein
MSIYLDRMQNLLDNFPPWVREAYNDPKSERNTEAKDLFDVTHTISIDPFPEEYNMSMRSVSGPGSDPTVLQTLW